MSSSSASGSGSDSDSSSNGVLAPSGLDEIPEPAGFARVSTRAGAAVPFDATRDQLVLVRLPKSFEAGLLDGVEVKLREPGKERVGRVAGTGAEFELVVGDAGCYAAVVPLFAAQQGRPRWRVGAAVAHQLTVSAAEALPAVQGCTPNVEAVPAFTGAVYRPLPIGGGAEAAAQRQRAAGQAQGAQSSSSSSKKRTAEGAGGGEAGAKKKKRKGE
eukprot:TRINITY_DN3409_c0_g1_i1.p2 TRINITY_DN3409_c0_g1~~TRINITY_DN3409_c0_g1_i1.p2  ORF type:complete len:224 (+),score=57.61 TRINITY_DN3409_c0_g1_i1:30-674(+)